MRSLLSFKDAWYEEKIPADTALKLSKWTAEMHQSKILIVIKTV